MKISLPLLTLTYPLLYHPPTCMVGSCSAEEHFCFVFMVLAGYHAIELLLVRGVDLIYRPLNHEGVINLVTWVLLDTLIIIVASIMPGRAAQNAVLSANNELAVKGRLINDISFVLL